MLLASHQVLAEEPSYSVVDLEFPGSNFSPRVTDINNKNQVVGWTNDSSDGSAKIWIYLPEADYGYPAGVTVIPIADRNAFAYSINDHGVIAGFTVDTSSFPQQTRAMIFQNGTITSEFHFTSDVRDSSAITSISNSGHISGYTTLAREGSTGDFPTVRVGVVRNPTQSIFTNPVTFNSGTFAAQINSAGVATADLILSFKSRGGTFDGEYQPIGSEPTSRDVRRPATDINEKGQVVGVTNDRECYLYLPESDYGLEAGLHVLFVTGGAPVINDVGQIMTTTHLWDKGDLYLLSDILPEDETREHTGALPSGILSGVKGINNFGNAVTSLVDRTTNETSISLLLAKPVLINSYEEWLLAEFGEATINNAALEATVWGNLADPDNDGLSNLAEAYHDRDPQIPDVSPFTAEASGGSLSYTWQSGASTNGVAVTPEWSPDLNSWFLSGDGGRTITSTPSEATLSGAAPAYLRLRYSR